MGSEVGGAEGAMGQVASVWQGQGLVRPVTQPLSWLGAVLLMGRPVPPGARSRPRERTCLPLRGRPRARLRPWCREGAQP